jgi:molybdate transport system regulatory protein
VHCAAISGKAAMLKEQNMPRVSKPDPSPQLKIRLRMVCEGDDAFGPGKAQLLESLLETASLNRTASGMKMSYVKALALVRAMNAHFHEPLVVLSRGGVKGGGTQVTDTGRKVLAEYQAMCAASQAAAQPVWRRLRGLLRA